MTILRDSPSYTDRFGYEWSIRTERKTKCLTFTCGEFQLVAADGEVANQEDLTSSRVKEIFCDAERVLEHGDQKWYVGFRTRAGRGGRAQGGVCTRFRSEAGEVRYSKTMLHFRHMPEDTLLEHLAAAQRVAS